MSSVKATLEIREPKPVYTSGDYIAGTVVVSLGKSVSVDKITLKCKCEAKTKFMVDEMGDVTTGNYYRSSDIVGGRHNRHRRQQRPKDRLKWEDEKIYQKEIVLFPQQTLAAETSGKGFTLAAGTHRYDFTLRLPGDKTDNFRMLPPSLSDPQNYGSIKHILKITVKRSSALRMNTRVDKSIQFTPSENVELLNVQKLLLIRQMTVLDVNRRSGGLFSLGTKGSPVNVMVEAEFPQVIAQAPHKIPLKLRVRSDDRRQQIAVRSYGIFLVSTTVFMAQGSQQTSTRAVALAGSQRWDVGTTFDFTNSIGLHAIKEYLLPTFSTRLIQQHWRVVVQVDLADPLRPKSGVQAVLTDAVTVLPPYFYYPPGHQLPISQPSSSQPSSSQSAAPAQPHLSIDHGKDDISVVSIESMETSGAARNKVQAPARPAGPGIANEGTHDGGPGPMPSSSNKGDKGQPPPYSM